MLPSHRVLLVLGAAVALALRGGSAAVVTYQGRPNDSSNATVWANQQALQTALSGLRPGDVLQIPQANYTLMGGIMVYNLSDVVFQWPRDENKRVRECLHFIGCRNLTITSQNPSARGLLDGQGGAWWGIPGIGYLEIGENRPRMLNIENSQQVLLEHISFVRPPYWTVFINGAVGLEIRFCDITAYRVSLDEHTFIDLSAFNTDGFDVTGRDIYIHDVEVWNQDDCVCIKDDTQDVVVERVKASGLGLTIGSISSHVRNITFRDCYMRHTYKGIYMKFRGAGLIEDVLYENIYMDAPEQYPIWIGPAQQSDSSELCAAHPCSICWPEDPLAKCGAPGNATYRNIVFRNVTIDSPKGVPGVILANATSPMENVTFDGVVVHHPSSKKEPWGTGYLCEGVASGVATGGTSPVPGCFKGTAGMV